MDKEKKYYPISVLSASAAEILAAAVVELFPSAQLVSSACRDVVFSYDFVIGQCLNDDAIAFIEKKMVEICREKRDIIPQEMMRENAIELFKHQKQECVVKNLEAKSQQLVQIFKMENFVDLYSGGYIENTEDVKAFKLQEINLRENPFGNLNVTRISGVVARDKKELKKRLKSAEAAKKCDHRIIAKEEKLFAMAKEPSEDSWMWLPKGAFVKKKLMAWWEAKHENLGFQWVESPCIITEISPSQFYAQMFQDGEYSCKERPIRFAEIVRKYFKGAGAFDYGIMRSSLQYVDMATTFCREEQVKKELISFLKFFDDATKMYGIVCRRYLCIRSQEFVGGAADWKKGLAILKEALSELNLDVQEEALSREAYGPRLEMRYLDALGREWDGGYLEIDFHHPKQKKLLYQDADGKKHMLWMLSRSFFGSLERFIALLVENCMGVFPLYLAKEQIRVLAVSDGAKDYADKVLQRCREFGFRVYCDNKNEKLATRVHSSQKDKVPYTLVVGEKEKKDEMVNMRFCNSDRIHRLSLEDFLKKIKKEVSQNEDFKKGV